MMVGWWVMVESALKGCSNAKNLEIPYRSPQVSSSGLGIVDVNEKLPVTDYP
jgi:hypothetical protein